MAYSQEEYERRHICVLKHAARYRLILPSVATSTFGLGKAIPQVYTRLLDGGYLEGHPRVLPGGQSCYVLTPSGCKIVNTPTLRGKLMEGAALDLAIGVSVFCHLGRVRRYRVEAEEASLFLKTQMPQNLSYVLSRESGKAAIYRCVASSAHSLTETMRSIRMLLEQAHANSKLSPWVNSFSYGFAILCENTNALSAMEAAVRKCGLQKACSVIVGLGPTAETLTACLKAKGN